VRPLGDGFLSSSYEFRSSAQSSQWLRFSGHDGFPEELIDPPIGAAEMLFLVQEERKHLFGRLRAGPPPFHARDAFCSRLALEGRAFLPCADQSSPDLFFSLFQKFSQITLFSPRFSLMSPLPWEPRLKSVQSDRLEVEALPHLRCLRVVKAFFLNGRRPCFFLDVADFFSLQ